MKIKLFLSFWIILLFNACKEEKESMSVTANDVTESVYASGKVKAEDQYNVYSTVNGVLSNVFIKAGDFVAKDQVILELDHTTSTLNAENAKVALNLSSENNSKGSDKIQEMELMLQQSTEKLNLDSTLYYRQKKLWEQNIGTQLDLEQKKLTFTNSQINYKVARAKYLQLKTMLSNDLNRATINYDISQKLSNDYLIKSSINGKVYDVLKEKGELVTPQLPIAVIGKADTFLLELLVDENDIIKIKLGQQVLVNMDSYKGLPIEAIVSRIVPMMNERSRTFLVEAKLVKFPKQLFPNLSVEANIVIQHKKGVITIPNNYIIEGKYVLINEDEKREVKIGLKDYDKSEILSGLSINEIIYKP